MIYGYGPPYVVSREHLKLGFHLQVGRRPSAARSSQKPKPASTACFETRTRVLFHHFNCRRSGGHQRGGALQGQGLRLQCHLRPRAAGPGAITGRARAGRAAAHHLLPADLFQGKSLSQGQMPLSDKCRALLRRWGLCRRPACQNAHWNFHVHYIPACPTHPMASYVPRFWACRMTCHPYMLQVKAIESTNAAPHTRGQAQTLRGPILLNRD